MEDEGEVLVVQVSAPTAEAKHLAERLVEARLAACVQLLPGVRSVYHWQGTIEEAEETLMFIKSTRAAYPALEAEIRRLHSYQVPEILGWTVAAASAPYAAWVRGELGSPP